MNAKEGEVPLSGGRVTSGVVRIGNTVRRPLGPNSTFVHTLLRHLESVGYSHAPRLLGVDPQGREILTFVPGTVPTDLGYFSESQVREAARIIAGLHDATAGTPLAGDQQVVCHGDLRPCNCVLRFDVPVCLIDFDTAFEARGASTWATRRGPGSTSATATRFLSIRDNDFRPSLTPTVPGLQAIPSTPSSRLKRGSLSAHPSRTRGRRSRMAFYQWSKGCSGWVRENRRALEAGLRGSSC